MSVDTEAISLTAAWTGYETGLTMQPKLVTEGEFKGWKTWPQEPFEHDTAGPYYLREDDQGMVAAFRAARKHMNAGGVVHGGCLMSFADFALFALAHDGT
ncbi:MAG: hypothetical protein AAGF20_13730, partial [Pseudomonadota bacterium]